MGIAFIITTIQYYHAIYVQYGSRGREGLVKNINIILFFDVICTSSLFMKYHKENSRSIYSGIRSIKSMKC